MNVRKKIISEFSDKHIRNDAPMSSIEEVFVPMYLFHRYQIEGAAKVLGGLNYSFAVKGDGQVVTAMISPEKQSKALNALLNTIKPEALAVPEDLLRQIPPRAFGYPRTRETFKVRTGVTFDALSIAETAANMTVSFILHPERASRLIEYNSRDSSQPGLTIVIDRLITSTWKASRLTGYPGEIQRVVEKVVMYNLLALAADNRASEQARAIAILKLDELNNWIFSRVKAEKGANRKAHLTYSRMQIEKFLSNPEGTEINKPAAPPDGSPIGQDISILGELCSWN